MSFLAQDNGPCLPLWNKSKINLGHTKRGMSEVYLTLDIFFHFFVEYKIQNTGNSETKG